MAEAYPLGDHCHAHVDTHPPSRPHSSTRRRPANLCSAHGGQRRGPLTSKLTESFGSSENVRKHRGERQRENDESSKGNYARMWNTQLSEGVEDNNMKGSTRRPPASDPGRARHEPKSSSQPHGSARARHMYLALSGDAVKKKHPTKTPIAPSRRATDEARKAGKLTAEAKFARSTCSGRREANAAQ